MKAPKISVIIPAYNRGDLIERAIRSALEQEPPPFEVIVVDDCSTDDTAHRSESTGVTVIRNPVNIGLSHTRNKAIAASTGDWIAFLDSDDFWLPGHLARLVTHSEGHVIVGDSGIGSVDGKIIGHPGPRPLRLTSPSKVILPFNRLTPTGCMVKRTAFDQTGGFSGRRQVEDLELWIKILQIGTGIILPEVGFNYEQHAGQLSGNHQAMDTSLTEVVGSFKGASWWTKSIAARSSVMPIWDGIGRGKEPTSKYARYRPLLNPHRLVGLLHLLTVRYRVRKRSGVRSSR